MMGDTAKVIKSWKDSLRGKWGSLGWKVFQAVLIAFIMFSVTWLRQKTERFNQALSAVELNTHSNKAQWDLYSKQNDRISALEKAYTEKFAMLEVKLAEGDAQWNVLYEERRARRDLQAEVAAFKKLFEMLVRQNRIELNKINVRELTPRLEKKRHNLEEFKKDQMRQMAPNMPRK